MKPAICNRRFPAKGLLFLPFFLLSLCIYALGQQQLDMNSSQKLMLNEVNAFAERHLLKHFSPTAEVSWYLEKNGLVALYNENEKSARVYYKLNGNFEGCTKYYTSESLDKGPKSVLLRRFPGCKIMVVTEITNLEKQELFVKIKDGNYIRTVHFSDEGVEITENILDGSI
jgi:hypothetical protein